MTAVSSLSGILADAGRRRRHPRGSMLFFEGDPSHDVLVILSGDVKLERWSGGRAQMLELLGPGDWLGEMGVLGGGTRTASAVALSAVEVSVVDGDAFQRLVRDDHLLLLELVGVTGRRLSRASAHQVELGAADSLGRVCGRLLELGDRFGVPSADGTSVRSPLSQADIASWAGISRESVVKAFTTLRSLGWIRSSGQRITLVDLDALRARCGAH